LGYPRLDRVLENTTININKEPVILLAPTYGTSSFIRFNGQQIIKSIMDQDLKVIFRPHPMSFKKEKQLLKKIINSFKMEDNFQLDLDSNSTYSLHQSNLLITDWSGIAMDFSLALGKKVLFIDTPQKILNLEYKLFNLKAFEEEFRNEVGEIISLKNLSKLPEKVLEMLSNPKIKNEKLNYLREISVYNIGKSAEVGAEEIIKIKNYE
jgi:YidC/Oxa1 family membrane protein insertase